MQPKDENKSTTKTGGPQASSWSLATSMYASPDPSDDPFDGDDGYNTPTPQPKKCFPQQQALGAEGGARIPIHERVPNSPLATRELNLGRNNNTTFSHNGPFNQPYANNGWNGAFTMGGQGLPEPANRNWNPTASATNNYVLHALDVVNEVRLGQQAVLKQLKDSSARLTALENGIAQTNEAPPVRGQRVPDRGRMMKAKRNARKRACKTPLRLIYEGDPDYEALLRPTNTLSEDARLAKACLKKMVGAKYRKLCGVAVGEDWPEPGEPRFDKATGVRLYTPNFSVNVDHEDNEVISQKVGEQVYEDLRDETKRPLCLRGGKAHWNEDTLAVFARDSFRGFRVTQKTQVDEDAAARRELSMQKGRRKGRRSAKAKRRAYVAEAYLTMTGNDPSVLLQECYMSDEASGPEDEDETETDWKRRLMAKSGHDSDDLSDKQLRNWCYREVIKPAWRSDELSKVYRDLDDLWWKHVPESQIRKPRASLVRETERISNEPPDYPPYDFGIDREWYEAFKDIHKSKVKDYFKRKDPAGFGSNATPAKEEKEEMIL